MATKKAASKAKYVVIRTTGAGCHAGELVARDGTEVTLENARRIWRFDFRTGSVRGQTLSDVANVGAGDAGRVSAPVSEIVITGVIEVITCSVAGEAALRGAPAWS